MNRQKQVIKEHLDSVSSASHRFKGYKPEPEIAMRLPEIKRDPIFKFILRAWQKAYFDGSAEEYADVVDSLLNGRQFTAKDVESFNLALAEHQKEGSFAERAGLFLTVLMNKAREQEFEVRTGHLDIMPAYLCYKFRKTAVIRGNAGRYLAFKMMGGSVTLEGSAASECAEQMRGGSLLVRGDCGNFLGGYMGGGSVVVEGNAGHFVGSRMKNYVNCDPKIHVKGNAGKSVGEGMAKGEIRIDGKAESYDEFVICGKIYVAGKLVVDK